FRILGGWMSDKWGARFVMYLTFIVSLVVLFVLSYPNTSYVVQGMTGPIEFSFGLSVGFFVAMTVILGFVMSLGKAAVYKHIPVYYPHHVGSVGGLVGMIGGLGGFFLPIAFGFLLDTTGVWTTPFMLLFVLVAISTIWMHVAIRRMEHRRHPKIAEEKERLSDLPEAPVIPENKQSGSDLPRGAKPTPAE
ncbi:MFS transporter, partial [Rubrivivax gelatinosus]